MKFTTLKRKCKNAVKVNCFNGDLFVACLGTNPKQHIEKTVDELINKVCVVIDNWDIRNWENLVKPFTFADKYIGKYSVDLGENGWELVKIK